MICFTLDCVCVWVIEPAVELSVSSAVKTPKIEPMGLGAAISIAAGTARFSVIMTFVNAQGCEIMIQPIVGPMCVLVALQQPYHS